jgi:polyhydroxyalkanoate synthase subunit PhaC
MTEDDRAARFFRDMVANTEKMVKARQLFEQTKDEDVTIGTTPKQLVMRRDKVELFHYEPMAEPIAKTPVLLAYGLIGRYTMADLQPDRSLVRSLLSKGLDLWLIDWGQPGRTERWLTIDDYVDDYIDAAVDRIAQETGHDRITLLGICEGGVFTTCYAALHPEKVKNLVITITPIDFHADVKDKAAHHGFLNIWTRSLDPEDIDNLVDTYGVVPGEFMSSVFSMMTPMRSLTKYNVDLIDVVDDEAKFMNFLRMEKWLADRPHHPGEAAKQWLKDLYQENRLLDGSFELSGRRVDLKSITAPVLNVFALDDHIIPPDCSRALGAKIGSQDYTEIPLPGGHVDWIGTSLGGLIGMVLAALPGSPIRRIVINDIGPHLPWAGLLRLGANLNDAPKSFETIDQAEGYYRLVLAPFGQLEDEHWRHLTTHSVAWSAEERCFRPLCDPNIAHAFRNPWHYSVDLWRYWDAIDVPILVVRGQQSDLLPEAVLKDMVRRNRNVSAHTVQNCGHAPALILDDQIEVVTKFLNGGDIRTR